MDQIIVLLNACTQVVDGHLLVVVDLCVCVVFLKNFVSISLTADGGPQLARFPIPPTATLPSCLPVVSEDLSISPRFSPAFFFIAMQVQRSYTSP